MLGSVVERDFVSEGGGGISYSLQPKINTRRVFYQANYSTHICDNIRNFAFIRLKPINYYSRKMLYKILEVIIFVGESLFRDCVLTCALYVYVI